MGKRQVGWFKDYWRYFNVKGKKTRMYSFRNWVYKTKSDVMTKLRELQKSELIKVDHYRITREKYGYRIWII